MGLSMIEACPVDLLPSGRIVAGPAVLIKLALMYIIVAIDTSFMSDICHFQVFRLRIIFIRYI